MARVLFALLLAGALAAAEGRSRLTDEQRAELVSVVGGAEAWGGLRPDRQRMLEMRYARYLAAPEAKRKHIQERGLKEYLLKPTRRFDQDGLPPALRAELGQLPPGVRGLATKLAVMRLRQLRLDRGLRFLPQEARWAMFERLFPEPFDPQAAQVARKELEKALARKIAEKVRGKLAAAAQKNPNFDPDAHAREYVRAEIQRHEDRLAQQIRREIFKGGRKDAASLRRSLERSGYPVLERLRFVTPRQRELIRYAFRPHECPLLDLSFLGPKPDDRAAQKEWFRDYHLLGRLELLGAAGFPRELVLHLAGTGSPEDFWRAVRNLRGLPGPKRGG